MRTRYDDDVYVCMGTPQNARARYINDQIERMAKINNRKRQQC